TSRSMPPAKTTDPPAFWAASPYERPMPRAITPRGPAEVRMGGTSSSDDGRTTRAAVGDVRPQPLSNSRSSAPSAIDPESEGDHPHDRQDLKHPVPEHDVFGRTAMTLID